MAKETIASLKAENAELRTLIDTDPAAGLAQEYLSKIEAAGLERDAAIERANSLAIDLGRAEARLEDCRKGFEKFRADSETLRVD